MLAGYEKEKMGQTEVLGGSMEKGREEGTNKSEESKLMRTKKYSNKKGGLAMCSGIKRKSMGFMIVSVMLMTLIGITTETAMAQRAIEYPRIIPLISGRNGVVAAASSIGPSVGLKVLMDGGNAVDAAVTTAAMITVSEFISSGIGGHGIMMLYLAKTGEVKCLDWGGFLPQKFTIDQWGGALCALSCRAHLLVGPRR
jgi:hypothetical protein